MMAGNDEWKGIDQMRRILKEKTSFSKSAFDQRDIALLQVAYSAVNELCAPARCSLSKVAAL
jgi:hypothetical protein